MVAIHWRRGSLAALVGTLLLVHQAGAEPSAAADRVRQVKLNTGGFAAKSSVPGLGPTPPALQLTPPALTPLGPEKLGSVLGRVPTASWAMGCAAAVSLVVHALYQNASDRRRLRMQNCDYDCPDYRIDRYKETRERADVALRLSVFAAASALWLAYNDPQDALERMGQRKLPRENRGFRVKLKPERRGVWASVVAHF